MPEGPLTTDLDLSNTKTVVPLIADGHLTHFELKSLTVDSGEKGQTAKFEWELKTPAPSTEGTQINPGDFGSKFFDNIAMYAKAEAKNQTWFLAPIAKRVDGLLGTGDRGNPKGKPERPSIQVTKEGLEELAPSLVGKQIVAKMKVTTSQEYGTKNEIGTIYFPGDLPSA